FEWNREDLGQIFASLLNPPGENYKYFNVPIANYASSSYDAVKMGNKTVGFSLGVVDENINVGDVLTLVWGEENGGTKKVTVERHKQLDVRVKVSVTPYGSVARETYHQGWRTRT